MEKEILATLQRQEALLRSILAHIATSNQITPLIYGMNEEQTEAFFETYEKMLNDAIEHYLNVSVETRRRGE